MLLVAGQGAHLSPKCPEPECHQILGEGLSAELQAQGLPAPGAARTLPGWKGSPTMHILLFSPASLDPDVAFQQPPQPAASKRR